MVKATLQSEGGELAGVIYLEPKHFKTGSRGFYANGKIQLNGKRYQGNFMLIEIGSKNGNKGKGKGK